MSIIAIDFDGTCVEHEFPEIGPEVPKAVDVMRRLLEHDHMLILWTIRSGKTLEDAVEWFDQRDIELLGVNVNPTQHKWSESPKAYAHVFIDDAALGCPLVPIGENSEKRPFVDWYIVECHLAMQGYFS